MVSPLLLAAAVFIACTPATPPADGPRASSEAPRPANAQAITRTFPVEGMVCEGCQNSIQAAVGQLSGVLSCTANHKKKQAEVRYDPRAVQPAQIVAAIAKLGYRSALPGQPVPSGD